MVWTHPNLSVHQHVWHALQPSENMAIIFMESLHRTVVLVILGFSKMHIHRLGRYYPSCSLILSIKLTVIERAVSRSAFSARRFKRFTVFRPGRKSLFLCFLLFLGWWVKRVLEGPSQWRRWSSLFISTGSNHALVLIFSLISDGNLRTLFHQVSDGLYDWRILYKVRREVSHKLLQLGNGSQLCIHNLIYLAWTADSGFNLSNTSLNTYPFAIGSLTIGYSKKMTTLTFTVDALRRSTVDF